MKKVITESQLVKIVTESVKSVLNEVSDKMAGAAYVQANIKLKRLIGMLKNGVTTYKDENTGRLRNVNIEIKRVKRQLESFGDNLSMRLNRKYDPDREKNIEEIKSQLEYEKKEYARYLDVLKNPDNYPFDAFIAADGSIETIKSEIERLSKKLREYDYTQGKRRFIVGCEDDGMYRIEDKDKNVGSVSTMYKTSPLTFGEVGREGVSLAGEFCGYTDALAGYHDSKSGEIDKRIGDNLRVQRNVSAIRDYDEKKDRIERMNREEEERYNALPFYKRMFKQRPKKQEFNDKQPQWEPNENGEFDGYFRSMNPKDYDNDIDNLQKRKEELGRAMKRFS